MPINYQALYDLIQAEDPRGLQAAKQLTPQEQQEFFDFQKNLHRDGHLHESDDTLATAVAAGGAGVLPFIGRGVGSALTGVGGALKNYDIKKPMKPLGDLLEWAGKSMKPAAEPLPNGATVDELRSAGVGDASINALKFGRASDAVKPAMDTATNAVSAAKPMIRGWNADEVAQAQAMMRRGIPDSKIQEHIEAARMLKQLLGTP